MRKQLVKADAEWNMFADYYKIYQEFYEPEDNDKYWEMLIAEASIFCKKYNTRYARDIMNAYIDSRERIYKNLKKP